MAGRDVVREVDLVAVITRRSAIVTVLTRGNLVGGMRRRSAIVAVFVAKKSA